MTEVTRVILLTGLSGSGLSTALKSLEDIGYEVVDNLPLAFVESVITNNIESNRPIAIGIDARTRDFQPAALVKEYQRLQKDGRLNVDLVYIECDTEILQKRFTETRRRHPMAKDRPVVDGIEQERALMNMFLNESSLVIDTSEMNIHELRRLIRAKFSLEGATSGLKVILESFGFRYGLPRDADIVMDVRFLRNPHYDENLRPMTGQQQEVGDYIAADPLYETFFAKLLDIIATIMPRYAEEGKSYLTIAIGCTGGKHRSVYTVERLFKALEKADVSPIIKHRDLHRMG